MIFVLRLCETFEDLPFFAQPRFLREREIEISAETPDFDDDDDEATMERDEIAWAEAEV